MIRKMEGRTLYVFSNQKRGLVRGDGYEKDGRKLGRRRRKWVVQGLSV